MPNLSTKSDMLKIDFAEKTIDPEYQQFMEHPAGVAKKKQHVL
jgi:hypothetical protein